MMKRFQQSGAAKRLVFWCLALCLTLAAGLALAAPGDATILPGNDYEGGVYYNLYSPATDGKILYAFVDQDGTDNHGLFSWTPGDKGMTPVVLGLTSNTYNYNADPENADSYTEEDLSKILGYLFMNDGQLYNLDVYTQTLQKLTIAEGALTRENLIKLDLSCMYTKTAEYVSTSEVISSLFTGDTLYMALRNWDDDTNGAPTLYAWDVVSGVRKTFNTKNLYSPIPYQDGKLLCIQYDQNNSWDEATQTQRMPDLVVFDPVADTAEVIYTFEKNIDGLCYSADKNTLYYFVNGRIMMLPLDTKQEAIAAYFPISYLDTYNNCQASLIDGCYVGGGYNGWYARNVDPAYLPTISLTIYGGGNDSMNAKFNEEYPNVPVVSSSTYYDGLSGLSQAMVTGTDSIDVLWMDSQYGSFRELMNKGYCLDLSGSEKIMEAVSRMYPNLIEPLTKDGKLYGIPISLYCSTFGYQVDMLEQVGITEEELPTTYGELFELLNRWEADYGDDYLPLYVYDSDPKSWLFSRLLKDYCTYYEARGETLTFDTPMFRELVQQLEKLDLDYMAGPGANATDSDWNDYYEKQALLTESESVTNMGNYRMYSKPLHMSLTKDVEEVLSANATIIFINPSSANPDMAIKLLESYLDNISLSDAMVLYADITQPPEDPRYEARIKSFEDGLKQITEAMKTADDSQKKDLQYSIDYYNEQLARKEEIRYLCSQATLDNYRENIGPKLTIAFPGLLDDYTSEGSTEISSLIDRYKAGQLPLENFIREADSKIMMIQMERQ